MKRDPGGSFMGGVWLAAHGVAPETQESVLADVGSALAREGVLTTPAPPGSLPGPWAIVFETVDAALVDFVRAASRDGIERVVGIAIGRADRRGDDGTAWRLLQAGASDVVAWRDDAAAAKHVAARWARWHAIDAIIKSGLVEKNLIGKSRAWVTALRQIVEGARFTDAAMLVLGESGTGKELAARLVHMLDPRPDKGELVVLDCTTIVPELSGSEFFGHERGAYTGAVGPRDGAFALAHGGTLFLDEIGELPLALQAQLLRVVQEGTYKRVGGNAWHKASFRLVCATNRDLKEEVARGRFRGDLYHRLATNASRLPPLRDRVEDILVLARHFMRERTEGPLPEFDDDVRDYLVRREYPGNVRDLKHLVSRIAQRYVGVGRITVGDLPSDERPIDATALDWRDEQFENAVRRAVALGAGLKDIGRTAEDVAVRIVVGDEDGNLQRAATRLGVTDRALQMRRTRLAAD